MAEERKPWPRLAQAMKYEEITQLMSDTGDGLTVGKISKNELKLGLTIDAESLDPIPNGLLPTPEAGQVRTMEVVGPDANPDGSPATATWTHPTLPGGSASLVTGKRGTFYFNGTSWALRNVQDLPKADTSNLAPRSVVSHLSFTDNYDLNAIIKELYLTGIDPAQEYYVRAIYKNAPDGTWRLVINRKSDNVTVARFQATNAVSGQVDSIISLGAVDSSGISGYAVIDWNAVTAAVSEFNPPQNTITEKAKRLSNSSTILQKLDTYKTSVYNIDEINPLATGTYHTKSSARLSIPQLIRRKGTIITYQTAQGKYTTERYVGDNNQSNDTVWPQDQYWLIMVDGSTVPTSLGANGQVATIENGIPVYKNPIVYADRNVSVPKGKNLFDKSAAKRGFFLDTTTGAERANSGSQTFNITDFIPVVAGKTYYMPEAGSRTTIGYGSDKDITKPIKLKAEDSNFQVTTIPLVTIPTGVSYIRKNFTDANIDTFYVVEGTSPLSPYEPYEAESFVTSELVKLLYSSQGSQDLPLSGKKFAIISDSFSATTQSNWVAQAMSKMGVAQYQNFAVGGSTWTTRYVSGALDLCVRRQVENLISSGFVPDFIFVQAGGNDISSNLPLGTLEAAFASSNYLTTDDTNVYGAMRRNIEVLTRTFPNAVVVVGTTAQRHNSDAVLLAKAAIEVASKFALNVIDTNKYSGIAQITEAPTPGYSDNPAGAASFTRQYPRYNWVEPNGNVVDVTEKSPNAVKRYAKFTWDGTHQTEAGENHIAKFMARNLEVIAKNI